MLSIMAPEGARVGHCRATSCVLLGSTPAARLLNPPGRARRLFSSSIPGSARDHRARKTAWRPHLSHFRKPSGQTGRLPVRIRQLMKPSPAGPKAAPAIGRTAPHNPDPGPQLLTADSGRQPSSLPLKLHSCPGRSRLIAARCIKPSQLPPPQASCSSRSHLPATPPDGLRASASACALLTPGTYKERCWGCLASLNTGARPAAAPRSPPRGNLLHDAPWLENIRQNK